VDKRHLLERDQQPGIEEICQSARHMRKRVDWFWLRFEWFLDNDVKKL